MQNKSMEDAEYGVVKMKKIVVGDVEDIRTCERRRRKEDKITNLAQGGRGGGVESGRHGFLTCANLSILG